MLRYTTDHAASSHGNPVLVDEAGNAYGPADLISTRKAAELLGISLRRVQALVKDLRLPAEEIAGRHVIRAGDLEKVAVRQPVGYPKGRPRKPAT